MQIDNSKLDNIPKNSYLIVQNNNDNEDHIIEKHVTTGARVAADQLTKDVFTYIPKGMSGSKNSNFYEFLSIGMVPYLVGSATLIGITNLMNKQFGGKNTFFANKNGLKMGAGVLMYAAGKWLGQKAVNKGVEAKTGIDLDMPYKKVIHELPEGKNAANNEAKTAVEFHKVYESATFPRWDLINKQGEQNGNRYEYYDKMAKRMGYKEDLNAPDQVVQPKIREVVVKSNAARSLSGYLWAAIGVAMAAQDSFADAFNYNHKPTVGQRLKNLPGQICDGLKNSAKDLAKTKFGKGMLIAAATTTALGIWNATRSFKADKPETKSTVDYKEKFMEF